MSDNFINLMNSVGKELDIIIEIPSEISEKSDKINLLEGKGIISQNLISQIEKTRSSIIITTPQVIPELLQTIAERAYQKKAIRFMYCCFNLEEHSSTIQKLMTLGNIQFRYYDRLINIFTCTRDAEEVLVGINTKDNETDFGMISDSSEISKFYSNIIGPSLQVHSIPFGFTRKEYEEAELNPRLAYKKAKAEAKRKKKEEKLKRKQQKK